MIKILFISIFFSFLFYLILFLYKTKIKKEEVDLKLFTKYKLINTILTIFLFFIIYFIITIFLSRLRIISIFNLYICIFILVNLINIKTIKLLPLSINAFKINKKLVSIITLILLIFIEIFIFNSIDYKKDKLEKVEYSFNDIKTMENSFEIFDDYLLISNEDYLCINNINKNVANINLNFNKENVGVAVRILVKNQGDLEYQYSNQYLVNSNKPYTSILKITLNEDIKDIKLLFYIDMGRIEVNELRLNHITLNDEVPLDFNLLRVLSLFLFICLIINLDCLFKKYKLNNTSKIVKLEKIILISGLVIISIYLIQVFINYDHYFIKYPLENVSKSDIYLQTFDAFHKGRLDLDLYVDPKLIELENPYDPINRSGISYYWDHAFYNGKYYCYYGVMPVILVMFPFHFITGDVCNVTFLQELAVIMLVFAILLAILEMLKTFVKKINYPFLYVFLVVAIFTSLSLSNITYKKGTFNEGIYSIPIVYGNLFIMLFLFTTFKAYNSEKKTLFLALGALFICMTIASRPNLIFYVIFTIPFYLSMLFRKVKLKQKIKEFLPFSIILLSGAIVICLYNYLRYDSIIEFGQFYQLTVIDNTSLKITFKSIISSVLHFFSQPFKISNIFPYINFSNYVYSFETHSYIVGNIGILMIPLFYSFFLTFFAIKKKDKIENKLLLPLMIFVIICLCVITYSFAGVCPRYMVDIYPLCTLTSILIIFKILSEVKEKRVEKLLLTIFSFFGLFSSFICFNFIFNSFNGINHADLNGIIFIIKDFFMEYNH